MRIIAGAAVRSNLEKESLRLNRLEDSTSQVTGAEGRHTKWQPNHPRTNLNLGRNGRSRRRAYIYL